MIATADRRTLLTVGIPVHNAMPFLPAAVESILGQTCTDFQLLIIVDGSTDGSLEYLETIRDSRLRILVQQHCGLTFTLNRMLRECETEWLVRQDADDVSEPSRLQTISDAIAAHPSVGMFYSLAAYYPQDKSVGMFRSTRGSPEQIRGIVRTGYIPAICHPTAVLHVERTLALSGYRPGIYCEDADLWWRMALAYDIHFIPQALLLFRQNAESLTSHHLEEQQLHGLYVQYLLLSQLQSRTARPLSEIESVLRGLMLPGQLAAKQALRQFNISLGQRRRIQAYQSLLRALTASPRYVLRRLRDELFPNRAIHNGIRPKFFYRKEAVLWTMQSN
jgi:GT2 family glycosyltransferase